MKVTISVLALVFASAVCSVSAANYAVLVAGSSGYYNYRHQSDVCHAFHVLTNSSKGAIPKENVITFMYDDIANNPQNPVQGNIINHPDGVNVYPGVVKDYTKDAVNPDNFLAVLAGNKSGVTGGTGRVLESGPEDNVFVYFADHGAPGLIAFPATYLYANRLMATLKQMHTSGKYKQLVFYIEACESGSMFNNLLPSDMGIYATTAATPDQSSYACYYDQKRATYLGDEYSVRWMEDSDMHDHAASTWTLEEQYKLVAKETLQSQPQQYGQLSIDKDTVETFEGDDEGKNSTARRPRLGFTPCGDAADSRDVKLKVLRNRLMSAAASKADVSIIRSLQVQVEQELLHRSSSDFQIDSILETLVGGAGKSALKQTQPTFSPASNWKCYEGSMAAYERACGKFSDYSLKWAYVFANLCQHGVTADAVLAAATKVCGQ